MKTFRLTKKDIYQGHLVLVNKQNPIRVENVCGAGLVPVDKCNKGIFLDSITASRLSRLIKRCDARNRIVPVSGYRSLREQEQIFRDSIRENGEAFTLQFVALPNSSEHQTGLAIDLAEQKEKIDFIRPDFPYGGICGQFRAKAADYGFIERYPSGKEDITGISHEPWHFRYVGYPHSKIIQNEGFAMEEYIDFIREYPFPENSFTSQQNGTKIKVFFINLSNDNPVTVRIPHGFWQLSGNNVDGAIITAWG